MDYEAVNLTGSATGLQQALDSAVASLNAYNQAAQTVLAVNLKVDKANGDSIQTMERMINEYTKLTTVIKTNAAGQQEEASKITIVTNELKKQAAARKELEQASRTMAAQTAESQTRASIPVPQVINTNGLVQYQQNLSRIKGLLESGKLSASQFTTVLSKVGSGDTNFAGFTSSMNTAYVSLTRMKGAVTDLDLAGNKLRETGGQLGLTWKNIFNIGEALLFKQALAVIVGELTSSVAAAMKLQIQIAEIRTISQESQSTFGEWNKALLNVSNNLGLDIHDVAGAAYEALSNQTTKGAAQTEKFLTTAGEFARTTVSSTKDAVDLLSGAMNSYGLKVDQAERISAIFFKTIDLGKVRADELSNSMGRINQPAAAIGVKIEEAAAALTTLTRNGVTAHDAQTQLLNVFTRLLKPAGDLKELMESWGTPTIQAANATFGFAGVLEKLQKAAKGSSTELAAMFPDVRGLRGISGLTQGTGFEQYKEDLAKIQSSGAEYDLAKQLRAEPAADEMIKQLNRIKNFFINDFANSLIGSAKSINDTLGKWNLVGFNSLEEAVKTLSKAFLTFGEILVAYRGMQIAVGAIQGAAAFATWAYTAATKALWVSKGMDTLATGINTAATNVNTTAKEANLAVSASLMRTLAGALPFIAAAGATWYLLSDQISGASAKAEEFKNISDRIADRQKKKEADQRGVETKAKTDQFEKVNTDQYKEMLDALASGIQEDNAKLKDFKNTAEDTDNALKNTFSNYIDNLKKGISEFEKAAEQASSAIKSSERSVLSVGDAVDQMIAKQNEGSANEYQKIDILKKQVADAFKKIDTLSGTGDPLDLQEARRLLKEIVRYRGEVLTLQKQLGIQVAKNIVEGNIGQLGGLGQAEKYLSDYQKKLVTTWGALNARTNTDIGSKNAGKQVVQLPQEFRTAQKDAGDILAKAKELSEIEKRIQGQVAQNAQASATQLKNAVSDLERAQKKYTEVMTAFEKDGKTIKPEFRKGPTDPSLDPEKLAEAQKKALDAVKAADSKAQSITPLKQLGPAPTAVEAMERDKAFMESVSKRAKLSNEYFGAAERRNTELFKEALVQRDKAYKESIVLQTQNKIKDNATQYGAAQETIKNFPNASTEPLKEVVDAIKMLSQLSKDLKLPDRKETEGFFGQSGAAQRNEARTQSNVASSNIDKLVTQAIQLSVQATDSAKQNQPERFQKALEGFNDVIKQIKDNLEVERQARLAVVQTQSQAGLSPQARQRRIDEAGRPLEGISPDKNQPRNTVGVIIDQAADSLKTLTKQAQDYAKAQDDVTRLQQLQSATGSARTQAEETASILTNFAATAIQGPSGLAKATQDLTTGFQNLKTLMDSLNKGSGADKSNIPNAQAAPTIEGNPQSNIPGFATGGIVSGTGGIDTNLAWLTKGEYVMPVAQTEAFLPMLKAMHYGIPKGTGGNISTSVGDVNITVQGPMTPDKTIRQIGDQLRREIRRGNITLH